MGLHNPPPPPKKKKKKNGSRVDRRPGQRFFAISLEDLHAFFPRGSFVLHGLHLFYVLRIFKNHVLDKLALI